MKRLIVVLSGLLVLPAFADVTPISYDDVLDTADASVVDTDISRTVVVPVEQPSRAISRDANTSVRGAARVVPATSSATSARTVNSRTSSASRNATTARTGTVGTVSRGGVEPVRVSSRPSRNLSATDGMVGVTSRRATTATNPGVTARVGVAGPAVTGRVSSRAPIAQVRASSVSAVVSTGNTTADTVIETTTEEKQDAIAKMDDLTQLSDYCKAQYTSCMDNFCNVLDDNQGRCSCSKNIKNYEKTEAALKSATEALQDVAQQIQYIGLTGDEIETLFSQTEAEMAMQATTDNTQIKNDLDNIKEMIVGIKTGTATSSETGMNFDLSGLLDFNIDNTGFDLSALFGGNNTSTNSISNQRGEQLYKTAAARCRAAVLNSCQNQGVDIAIITNAYDMEIDKQCIAYERQLIDANDNMVRTVRNAKAVLQKARLMVAQQKNSYDLRGCVNALDSCMQDDFVCGTDYENCLDPTGKYIVNGEVVIGSTPGFWIDTVADEVDGKYGATPVQHQTGLYATWVYGNNHAWYGESTNVVDYIDESIEDDIQGVQATSTNLVKFLQHKIGYNEDNRNYGMCVSVLNKCQNYTYDGKEFKVDNTVVREYLQRTLTQIKVAQDEIIANYAENCISDVNSCLSTNGYSLTNAASQNFAINACKAQITTCMSVNGNMDAVPTPDEMINWVSAVQSRLNTTDGGGVKTFRYNLNGMAKFNSGAVYQTQVVPGGTIDLPMGAVLTFNDGASFPDQPPFWCWKRGASATTVECSSATTDINATQTADFIAGGGVLYLSAKQDETTCNSANAQWYDDKGCVCKTGFKLGVSGTSIACVSE